MDSQDLRDIHRDLNRHEELLQSNGISLRIFSEILHNMEMQQQEQYDKIMSILEAHGEKNLRNQNGLLQDKALRSVHKRRLPLKLYDSADYRKGSR